MGLPLFYLQIVHANPTNPSEHIARFPGGGKLETDLIKLCHRHICAKFEVTGTPQPELIEQCVNAAIKQNIGLFKTKAQVANALRTSLSETINTPEFRTNIDNAIHDGIASAIMELKDLTKHLVSNT